MKKRLQTIAFILITGSAFASIIHVPGDYPTIQAGINAAVIWWDTVLVADGIYTGEGNRDIDFLGKPIMVMSENGPDSCIIDCQQLGRGFYFHSDEDTNSVLIGFTITNGFAEDGAGICFSETGLFPQPGPVINNCIITGNTVSDLHAQGGGIYCKSLSPTIIGCTISENIVSGNWADGGGIYSVFATPTIINCTIVGNAALSPPDPNNGYGGGICLIGVMFVNDDVLIQNCTISDNYASLSGGGIELLDINVVFDNCQISGNHCRRYGGGVNGYLSMTYEVSLIECSIFSNRSDNENGGLDFIEGVLNIDHCAIYSNSSEWSSSGVYKYEGVLNISNSTIADNINTASGCAVRCIDLDLNFINIIVRHSSSTACVLFQDCDSISISYCDVYNDIGAAFSGEFPPDIGQIVTTNLNGDSCDIYSNIFLDPIFYSTTGDSAYYLTEESPCIDAGDPVSSPDPDGTIADMGAYYYDQRPVIEDLIITIDENDVILNWSEIPDAVIYHIYRSAEP